MQAALLARGIIIGTSADPLVLRLMPPLIVEEAHIEHFARELEAVLRAY